MSPPEATKPPTKKRLTAGQAPGVGNDRYGLIRSAAGRIRDAMAAGYYLEATTLVESILAERLEKRAQFLHKDGDSDAKKKLDAVKDGFRTLERLIRGLSQVEDDPELRAILTEVSSWAWGRNTVIHEMVKLGDTARDNWDARLAHARLVAEEGIALVCKFDARERELSHLARGRRYASATCPDALELIGQPSCRWCAAADGE
jgi:hypothetical protein